MMRLAIAASCDSRIIARPNPWVGAIIQTYDNEIVSGSTQAPGDRHGEIVALDKLGDRARSGTLWVTLEPCSHHGKTPPCVERIISSGIERVVVGIIDPDPRVAGSGIKILREAGIEVCVGVRAKEVAMDLVGYLISRKLGRPMTLVKLASTLDGYIAASDGTSKWITNEESRLAVQELRADSDVIIAGSGTLKIDDPSLTVRLENRRSPLRVVLGAIPPNAKVHPARSFSGDIKDLLSELGKEGNLMAMIEGGAHVANQFLNQHLIDRLHIFYAPKVLGGGQGLRLFEGQGALTMAMAYEFDHLDTRTHRGDIEVIVQSKETTKLIQEVVTASTNH
ncbi:MULTISPECIES: bifunctional diaminohydroxyphosphoribosylaminopyrimidine deaminase/5-amino-6-(5-phosphoribosylamino)uracil reductase RibD [Acidithrix]|nr:MULTISPECIES: bifunctional diaminohydroxyphosphoribosylaminopyrimidine deaminase/5-amino-6-(5-phosphoribosylamino)uracil reductase RibD [Acidithrix]